MSRLRIRVVANQTPTTNNGTTHYIWDISGNIIAEVNGSTGVTLRETVYLEGMPLAAIDAVAVPKKTYAVHVDHLNRAFGARRSLARRRVMLTDAAKVNVWWASYEPFGKVRATGGTLTQNLGLPGQWFQLESGLAQNWHRHYDATTGRYTTADPLGFVDGPSVFAYAGNNPHRMVDPTGQFVPLALGAGLLYFGSTGSANAPNFGDIIILNNDGQIFDDAGTFLSGAGRVCRPVFEMVKRTRASRKDRGTDFPSDYKGYKPGPDETPREFADRVLKDTRYPNGGYDTGPRSDFNKLKKYGERYGK